MVALLGTVVWLAGCASGRAVTRAEPPSDPDAALTGSNPGSSGPEADRSEFADSALAAVAEGRWDRASDLADSVAPEGVVMALSSADAVSFAAVLSDLGREDRAARLLLTHPGAASSDAGIRELRRAASGMSVGELESLDQRVTSRPGDRQSGGVIAAELARAYALAGMEEEAARAASRRPDGDTHSEDRRTIEQVLDGDIAPLSDPVRLGVILSLTGRFAQVGDDLQDGILLALAERGSEAFGERDVDLVVLDDGSDVTRVGALLDELQERGVSAVIGPIRSEALSDVAASRISAGLAIISPTASRDSGIGPNAYSLWERGRREAAIGDALGRWFPERMGLYRLGALYPADDGGRAGFRAFESAVLEAGAVVVGAQEFEPDSTTFEIPIRAVHESDPEGVFVLGGDPGTVLQIAPQLPYFGLRSRIIAGGEAWTDPAVLRRLEPAFADYRIVATFLDRGESGTQWTRYVESYEREFRRTVPDNLFPALGYDATRLVLAGLDGETLGRPGAVSRSISGSGGLDGATGRIRFTDAGQPGREVDIRMLLDGQLVEVDTEALSVWAEEARAQEELMLELEEEEEKRKAARDAERQ